MIECDGLEMLVRFYYNQNQLTGVSKQSGVPVERIEKWMKGGKLSKEDREALSKDIAPEFTGKVYVGGK
ncbi:hypothetical protein LCGC14_1256160, partial [marine sediment metagenome]